MEKCAVMHFTGILRLTRCAMSASAEILVLSVMSAMQTTACEGNE